MTDERRTGMDRRRGRPPIQPGERSVNINVAVGLSMFDAVDRVARKSGESMPEIVRRALRKLLRDEASAVIRI